MPQSLSQLNAYLNKHWLAASPQLKLHIKTNVYVIWCYACIIQTFILYWQVNCDFPSWNGIIHGSSCSIPCNTATEIKQCLSAENLNSTEINQH